MKENRQMRRCVMNAVGAAVIALSAGLVLAQNPPAPGGERKPGDLPPFAEVTKDMKPTATGGLFTIYTYDANDPTKEPSRIVASIPKSLIGKDMLLATSISRGGNMGYPAGSDLIRFELAGNKVLIAVPDVTQKQQAGRAITSAVEATYTPGYLAVLPIISKGEGGDVVVDMTGFFTSATRFVGAAGMAADPRRGGGVMLRYSAVKAFPENVLVQTEVISASPDGGTSVGVGYSFRILPDLQRSDYKPRVADERIGYFPTVRQDWNTPYTDRENIVRYINRWNLQKKDPSLEASPPAEPIVFIIEKTVPLQWRRFVKEGIEEWNKAYEAIGITNAIQVYQQTDDNEFANIDPEDARYNFFRWIVTGRGFAMGPSRPDPRTGEILDADIIFDDSMVRGYLQDFGNLFGAEALSWQMGPEVIEFLEKNPNFIPMGMTAEDVRSTGMQMRKYAALAVGNTELLQDDAGALASSRTKPVFSPHACTYAQGMQHQMSMLSLITAAKGDGRKVPERLIGEMVRDITSHEVGHTLGLRHNFKGSTWLSPEEIKKRRDAGDEATFASTMDYNGMLLFPGDKIEAVKHVTSPVIGPYDFWAIEYGYTADDKGDALAKIAQRSNEPGLAYATDEDVMGMSSPDPRANRWDMSSDPIAWATNQAKLADEMLSTFQTWAVKPTDPSYYLRSAYLTLMFDKTRNLSYVARLVGGQEFNRNRAGDPDAKPPLTPIAPEEQRKALDSLASTIFSEDFLKLDPELLNKLVPGRNWDDRFGEPPARVDFPAHQSILSLQNTSLFTITNPVILQRIYDAELKTTAENKFTAAELLSRGQKMIWGDLKVEGEGYTDAKPMISSLRRNLQKQWLNNMIAMAKSQPGSLLSADLQSMVRYSLREMSGGIEGILKSAKTDTGSKIDLGTRAHLAEAKSRIDRVLEAPEIDMQLNLGGVFRVGRDTE